jgi:hypothetical protein
MSEKGGLEQPQRFCTNCGAQIRSGNAFCVSCGTPVTAESGEPGPSPSSSDLRGRLRSFLDDLRRSLRQSADGLRNTFPGPNTDVIRRLPRRAVEWFRDLSSIPKLVLVGLVSLALLVLLSPLAVLVSALVLGVSIIALIVRVAQRGSVKGWAITAVVSLAFAFAFVGISDVLYGGSFVAGGDPGRSRANDGPVYGASSEEGSAEQVTVNPPEAARHPSLTVPPYTVVDSGPLGFNDPASGDVRGLSVVVGTSFTLADPSGVKSYEDMAAIVKDVENRAPGYDVVYVKFLASIPDPDAPVPSAVYILTPVGADAWDNLSGPNTSVILDSAGYYCLDGQVCVEGVSIPHIN